MAASRIPATMATVNIHPSPQVLNLLNHNTGSVLRPCDIVRLRATPPSRSGLRSEPRASASGFVLRSQYQLSGRFGISTTGRISTVPHAARADLLRAGRSRAEGARSNAGALGLVTNDSERRFLERRLREVQPPAARVAAAGGLDPSR